MEKVCGVCGTVLSENDRFCPGCGSSVDENLSIQSMKEKWIPVPV